MLSQGLEKQRKQKAELLVDTLAFFPFLRGWGVGAQNGSSPCTLFALRVHLLDSSVRASPGLTLICQEVKIGFGAMWVYSVVRTLMAPARG